MSPNVLPRYVDRGGEPVWRHPSVLTGARIYGFGVDLKECLQQKYLDKYINRVAEDSTLGKERDGKPFRLNACQGIGKVLLLFVDYESIESGNDDDKDLGAVSYREFLIMQLGISDDPEYPELDWLIPFIYLDSDVPRLAGREIYGYPKQLSRIDDYEFYGGDRTGPAKLMKLSPTVIPANATVTLPGNPGGPTNAPLPPVQATDSVIVEIKGPDDKPEVEPYDSAVDAIWDLWRQTDYKPVDREPQPFDTANARTLYPFSEMNPAQSASRNQVNHPGVDVLDALFMNRIGNVFLKEFRDCETPGEACYQAICKTDTFPAKFHSGGRIKNPKEYTITIANSGSEPIIEYLTGNPPSSRNYTELPTPSFAYVLNIDFELVRGKVIANPLANPFIPDTSMDSRFRQDGLNISNIVQQKYRHNL